MKMRPRQDQGVFRLHRAPVEQFSTEVCEFGQVSVDGVGTAEARDVNPGSLDKVVLLIEIARSIGTACLLSPDAEAVMTKYGAIGSLTESK